MCFAMWKMDRERKHDALVKAYNLLNDFNQHETPTSLETPASRENLFADFARLVFIAQGIFCVFEEKHRPFGLQEAVMLFNQLETRHIPVMWAYCEFTRSFGPLKKGDADQRKKLLILILYQLSDFLKSIPVVRSQDNQPGKETNVLTDNFYHPIG